MFSAGKIEKAAAALSGLVETNAQFMCDKTGKGDIDRSCQESEVSLANETIDEANIDGSHREISLFVQYLLGRQRQAFAACAKKFKTDVGDRGLSNRKVRACIVETARTGLNPNDKTKKAFPFKGTINGEYHDELQDTLGWHQMIRRDLSWRAKDKISTEDVPAASVVDVEFSKAVPATVLTKMNEGSDAVHKPYVRFFRLGGALNPDAIGELERFLREKPAADINGLPPTDAAKVTVNVLKLLTNAKVSWSDVPPSELFDGFTLSDATVGQVMALRQLYEQAVLGFFTKDSVEKHLNTLDDADKQTFIKAALTDLATKVNAGAKAEIAKFAGVDFAAAKDDARLPALEKMVVIYVTDKNDTHQPDEVGVALRETRLPIEYSDGLGTLNDTERTDYERLWLRIREQVKAATGKNAFVDGVRESVSDSAVNDLAQALFSGSNFLGGVAIADSAEITFDKDAKTITVKQIAEEIVLSFQAKYGDAASEALRRLVEEAKSKGQTDENAIAAGIDAAFDKYFEEKIKAAGVDEAGDSKYTSAMRNKDLLNLLGNSSVSEAAAGAGGKVTVTLSVEEKKEEAAAASVRPSKKLGEKNPKAEKDDRWDLNFPGNVKLIVGGVDGTDPKDAPKKSGNAGPLIKWSGAVSPGVEKEGTSYRVNIQASGAKSPSTMLTAGGEDAATASPVPVKGKNDNWFDEVAFVASTGVTLSDKNEGKKPLKKGEHREEDKKELTLTGAFGYVTDGPLNPVFGVRGSAELAITHTKPETKKEKNEKTGKVTETTVDEAQAFNGSTFSLGIIAGGNSALGIDTAHNYGDAAVDGVNYSINGAALIQFIPEFGLKIGGIYGAGAGDRENPDGTVTDDAYRADFMQINGGFVGKRGQFSYDLSADYTLTAKGEQTDWNVIPMAAWVFESFKLYLKLPFAGVMLSEVDRSGSVIQSNAGETVCDDGLPCPIDSANDKQGFYSMGATLGAEVPLNETFKLMFEAGGATQERALEGDNRSQNVGFGTAGFAGKW